MSRSQTQSKVKIKKAPKYHIVIHNDDTSDFNYVSRLIMHVFGFSEIESMEMTTKIHQEGNAIAWSGTKEVGELRKYQCDNFIKDYKDFLKNLKVTLEKV